MPLQIRRGTDDQRQAMAEPLASGELLYTTDTGVLYIGNGSTIGGVPVANLTAAEIKNLAAGLFTSGTHSGITYTYDSEAGTIDSVIEPDLSNYDGVIRASSFSGNLVADDSGLMVNAETGQIVGPVVNNSVTTDSLTMKGDILPDITETHDIGSSSLKFKDLYLSGSSLYLGNAQINAVGDFINLPESSTVDGDEIAKSDLSNVSNTDFLIKAAAAGVSSGGGGSDFFLSVAADDSTEYPFLSGNTLQILGGSNLNTSVSVDGTFNIVMSSNPTFFDVTADKILDTSGQTILDTVQLLYQGNVLGNLISQDSSLAFNSANQTFFGTFTGDHVGESFGVHNGPVIGNLTGQTTGEHFGNVLGDILGSIFAVDSTKMIDPEFQIISGDTLVTNFVDFREQNNNRLEIRGDNSYGLIVRNITTGSPGQGNAPTWQFVGQRGTIEEPENILAGDLVGSIRITGYHETGVSHAVSMYGGFSAGADMFNNEPESFLVIHVGKNGGVQEVSFDHTGAFTAPIFKTGTYANDTARDAAIPTPSAGMIIFNQRDDSTGVPQFQGYDGTTWVDLH